MAQGKFEVVLNDLTYATLGDGTVKSIVAGNGLTGGTITSSGTIAINNTGVAAGAYTNPNVTVGADGRLTQIANGAAGGGVTTVSGTVNQVIITGTSSNPIVGLSSNTRVPGKAGLTIPVGTTADRDPNAPVGTIRFNTDL